MSLVYRNRLRRVSLRQLSNFLLDQHQPPTPKEFGLLLNSEWNIFLRKSLPILKDFS